jgi:type III pantothenate kinase
MSKPVRAAEFLVVDVSNSFTKYAVSSGQKLGRVQTIPTKEITPSWLLALQRFRPEAFVYLSSVVPSCTVLFQKRFGARLRNLEGEGELGIKINYPHKSQIGADRLANAIAAQHYYGAPCVVLDFGTAVTFDVVDRAGAYTGGVIAPGLNVMTDYLHERTALLPKVKLREPRRAVGKSTEEAILSGAMIGYRGLIRAVLGAIYAELKKPDSWKVIATGGQAELVTKKMPEIAAVHPHLTLEGLRIWAGRHN